MGVDEGNILLIFMGVKRYILLTSTSYGVEIM